MQGSVKFARVMGVQVRIHFSWFVIFALVTWSLSAIYFPMRYRAWTLEMAWTAGVLTSLLFFASVLAHELAHSALARRVGLQVEGITLFIFGGMASIASEAARARDEFAIAIAGPLSSLALGVVFTATAWGAVAVGPSLSVAAAISWWLATINLMLAIFNLIPGFPMDGGRVLRSLIWGATSDYWLGTRIAATAGLVVAYLLLLAGVFLAVTGALANALWLILIAWFLSKAAHASHRQATVRESLKGVKVDQAMSREYRTIHPYMTLREAFENHLRPHRLAAVPVVAEDARILGLLTEDDLQRVPPERWAVTSVNEAMTAVANARTVSPDDEVNEVLGMLGDGELDETPVVAGGRLVGLLSRRGILDLLRRRSNGNS